MFVRQLHHRGSAFEAEHGASGSKLADEVGLGGAARHDDIGVRGEGLGQEVLELSGLISAEGEASQIVAFDPEVEAEPVAEPWKAMTWRWEQREFEARGARIRERPHG
jgi:hypothetical protein